MGPAVCTARPSRTEGTDATLKGNGRRHTVTAMTTLLNEKGPEARQGPLLDVVLPAACPAGPVPLSYAR